MLYFGLAAIALMVSGAIGGHLAATKGRNTLDWFWICMFLPVAGHLLLHLRPPAPPRDELSGAARRRTRTTKGKQAPRSAPTTAIRTAPHRVLDASEPGGRQQHWTYLLATDPMLAAAARKLAPLGTDAVLQLHDAFFIQQDRTLIPGLVARIEAHYVQRPVKTAPPPLKSPSVATAAAPQHAESMPALSSLASAQAASAATRPAIVSGPSLRTLAHAMPGTAARLVPRHTTVTAHDLDTAAYLETYRGIHLYQLRDGRVYIDGHLALASLDAARSLLAEAARKAAAPSLPAADAPSLMTASASPT